MRGGVAWSKPEFPAAAKSNPAELTETMMAIRSVRIVAGLVTAPLLLPGLVLIYGVFVSAVGRTGGYGYRGVPISPEGLRNFLTDTILPMVEYSYIVIYIVAIPVLIILKLMKKLSSPAVILTSTATFVVCVLLIVGGHLALSGLDLRGLLPWLVWSPVIALPTALVALVFCLIAGLPWRVRKTQNS
jgi:hypothetical protein